MMPVQESNAVAAGGADADELTDEELLALLPRPTSRTECLPGGRNAERPCPYVSCRFHLYLEVDRRTGKLQLNFPGRGVHQIPETCARDVAERGPQTLEVVSRLTNRSRERIRQLEEHAIKRMHSRALRLCGGA